MNKHMLFALQHLKDPTYYTKEQREENKKDASAAASAASAASAAANASAPSLIAEHWINKYFDRTGESKQAYIDHNKKEHGK